jgi:hypothetical protein
MLTVNNIKKKETASRSLFNNTRVDRERLKEFSEISKLVEKNGYRHACYTSDGGEHFAFVWHRDSGITHKTVLNKFVTENSQVNFWSGSFSLSKNIINYYTFGGELCGYPEITKLEFYLVTLTKICKENGFTANEILKGSIPLASKERRISI